MQNNNEEIEIGLRDLFVAVLRHWRKALVYGLVFMVLLGGFRFYKAYRSYQIQLLEDKDKRENNSEVWEYEQKKAKLEEGISRTEEMLDQVTEYRDKSVIMSMDPYDYYWATCTYYVTTNYQIIPELGVQDVNYTDSVLTGYSRMVVDNALYDDIRSVVGMDAENRFVGELFKFYIDYGSDMIIIEAIGHTEDEAKEILDIVCDKTLKETPAISSEIHEHEIKAISFKTEYINYEDSNSPSVIKIKGTQDSIKDQIQSLNETMIDLLDEMEELEKENPIVEFNVSGVVKYCILGFIIGMCLVGFVYCVVYVMGDSIKTEDELSKGYGLSVIGRCYPEHKSKAALDKKLDHIERGNLDRLTAEQVLALSAAKLSSLINDKGSTVVVAGTVDEAVSHKVFDQLKAKTDVKLEYAGNPLLDSAAIEKLNTADHVLVMERIQASRRSEVQSQMEMLSAMKKDIIGVLLV